MRFKISIFFSIIIVILFGGSIFSQRVEAAGWPTFDAIQHFLTKSGITKEVKQWAKEERWRMLLDQASKRIVDSIVNDTVRWIENGGNPRFITDWKKFLKDAGDSAIGDVVEETSAAFLCDPFRAQLKIALQPTPTYTDRISCSFSEIKDNIDAFYDDFSRGGWIAYQEAWAPNNNFLGAAIMAQDEMMMRSAKAEDAAKSEAQASGGFLPVKKCVLRDEADEDLDGDTNECLEYVTETPGKAVGDMASKALGAEGEWATNINSWTSVLTNALINRLTKEGVGLARGAVGNVLGNDGDNGSGFSPEVQGVIDNDIASENRDMTSEIQKFIDLDWNYVVSLKEESLIHVKKNYAMSSMIEFKKIGNPDVACNLPFGLEYRSKSIGRQVDQIAGEATDIKENTSSTIIQANQLITEINLAVNPLERANIQQKYNDFIDENNLESVESFIQSVEQEWQDSNSVLAALWKEFDRPECYKGVKEASLPGIADRLIKGETVSSILSNPGN